MSRNKTTLVRPSGPASASLSLGIVSTACMAVAGMIALFASYAAEYIGDEITEYVTELLVNVELSEAARFGSGIVRGNTGLSVLATIAGMNISADPSPVLKVAAIVLFIAFIWMAVFNALGHVFRDSSIGLPLCVIIGQLPVALAGIFCFMTGASLTFCIPLFAWYLAEAVLSLVGKWKYYDLDAAGDTQEKHREKHKGTRKKRRDADDCEEEDEEYVERRSSRKENKKESKKEASHGSTRKKSTGGGSLQDRMIR